MIHKPLPSSDRISQLLMYDPNDGLLYWKISQSPYVKAGMRAGSLNKKTGYIRIKLDKTMYAAHRLVWKIHKNNDPNHHIDHINGNKSDNRIENLREATNSQNIAAGKTGRKSKSGKTGVYFRDKIGKYVASFRKDKKSFYLGLFLTLEDAEKAYNSAYKEAFGEYVRNGD